MGLRTIGDHFMRADFFAAALARIKRILQSSSQH
jgi:hypothetical protein